MPLKQYIRTIVQESFSRADLYHALKIEHAVDALKNNKLDAYTTQRCWPDGKMRKDDDPEYEQCWWMKGLSLTRNEAYAKRWAGYGAVFLFDQEKLSNDFKILPYNWGNSIGRGYKQPNKKREAEEFLITGIIKKKFLDSREGGVDWMDSVASKPHGGLDPLDRYLIGIKLPRQDGKFGDWKKEERDFVENHSLFLGHY